MTLSEIRQLIGLFVVLFLISSLSSFPSAVAQLAHPFGNKRLTKQVLSYSNIKESLNASTSAIPALSTTEYCLRVPVIMYHHVEPEYLADENGHTSLNVNPEYFDMQMNYLAQNGYHTLSAEALVQALIAGTPLPDKSVVVTLDDGYQDVYDYAFPILKKYHITASLMIPTGLVGTTSGTNEYLTWSELAQMRATGSILIYSHTVTHAALGLISDKDIRREISQSQQMLQQKLGTTYPILTYPYGSYSDSAIRIAKELGFVGAFSTDPGEEQCRSQIMRLPRDHIGNAPLTEYGF